MMGVLLMKHDLICKYISILPILTVLLIEGELQPEWKNGDAPPIHLNPFLTFAGELRRIKVVPLGIKG